MAGPYSFSEYQQVYVACRSIFQGRNAKIRRLSKIKSVFKVKAEVVESVVEEMGEEKVANVALDLLREKVFKYETKARARFPAAFQIETGTRNSINGLEAERATSHTAEPQDDIFSSEDDIHVIRTPDWDSESDLDNTKCQNEADRMAEGLRNNVGACKIRELRVEIDRQVAIRQAAKTALEDHAATEMDDIRRQREELDKREQALIGDMAKKESKQKALLSGSIDRFLDSRFGKSAEQLGPQTERGEATEKSTEEATEDYTQVSKEESAEQSADDMEFDLFD
ncbi:hypothetical protein CGCS363_v010663 [Colletotrichum siamense]|uniref:uncharacterized protein n=1 Tax=Colletotrichum siamense TaxID=690259 RepID=UPI001872380E|nr:uncharacterized protein CGCS363_v010663 [Colletotrichum siamense]KAF5491625.1 hypothetical protein CGCS363_v010663 [Colletotrichum siamense]